MNIQTSARPANGSVAPQKQEKIDTQSEIDESRDSEQNAFDDIDPSGIDEENFTWTQLGKALPSVEP